MTYRTTFVFGSNLAGIHGAGAALSAKKHHGAVMGQGVGKQGDSYAIPTKDEKLKPLPLYQIRDYVNLFIRYANRNVDERFYVTKIGCGLAGYHDWEIAPLFRYAPYNCMLPEEWVRIIGNLGVDYDPEG